MKILLVCLLLVGCGPFVDHKTYEPVPTDSARVEPPKKDTTIHKVDSALLTLKK